jgi:hypothetical protein
MTNNPTIDGVSRAKLEQALNLAAVFDDGSDGADAESAQGVVGILRALLDAPVVERQPGCTTCHDTGIVGIDDECPVCTDSEVAALQSTITQLQARVAELESARGEPVARDQQVTELSEFMGRLSGGLRHFAGQIIDAGWIKHPPSQNSPIGFRDPEFSWATISAENKEMMASLGHDVSCFSLPLFTAPPAPVAVVLPERQEVESGEAYMQEDWVSGWNACLDATAALNGVRK